MIDGDEEDFFFYTVSDPVGDGYSAPVFHMTAVYQRRRPVCTVTHLDKTIREKKETSEFTSMKTARSSRLLQSEASS